MFQRGDGHFGAYVVRQTVKDDPHANLYDYDLTEHVIIAQEWFHAVSSFFLPFCSFSSFLLFFFLFSYILILTFVCTLFKGPAIRSVIVKINWTFITFLYMYSLDRTLLSSINPFSSMHSLLVTITCSGIFSLKA